MSRNHSYTRIAVSSTRYGPIRCPGIHIGLVHEPGEQAVVGIGVSKMGIANRDIVLQIILCPVGQTRRNFRSLTHECSALTRTAKISNESNTVWLGSKILNSTGSLVALSSGSPSVRNKGQGYRICRLLSGDDKQVRCGYDRRIDYPF